MELLIRFYRRCNLLSLDVAAGAVICALYFSKLVALSPRVQGMLALGFSVWVIYTVDRLLDVRRMTNAAASERHQFHQQYQKPLWVFSILTALAAVSLVYFLRPQVLVGGIILSLAAGLYLIFQKYLKLKEFFVAGIYTAGVLLPSITVVSNKFSYVEYLLIAQLFMVALTNLLIFSWFEHDADKQDGHISFPIRFGKSITEKWLVMLSVINFLIAGWLITQTGVALPSILFISMTMVLLAVYLFPVYFQVNVRYRLLGDAVFFIPVIGLLL
jgi:4-hydroxybenzoate polyprenyltransferase